MTRSGSPYTVPRDANRVPFLLAASSTDGSSPVALEADPITHNLLTLATGSPDLRFSGGKTPTSGTLNTAGDNVVITPAAGKQITVYWVSIIPNSDNSAANLCAVKIGAKTLYTNYVVSHWEPFQGAPDETVIINLTNTQPISYTVHYKTT